MHRMYFAGKTLGGKTPKSSATNLGLLKVCSLQPLPLLVATLSPLGRRTGTSTRPNQRFRRLLEIQIRLMVVDACGGGPDVFPVQLFLGYHRSLEPSRGFCLEKPVL